MPPTTSPASGVSGEMPPPNVVENCLGHVQLLSDGTVKRAQAPLVLPDDTPPVPCADAPAAVRWKDVVYDETYDVLSLRVYVPSAAGAKKLPVLVYFHGGGFCIGSFAMLDFHAACLRLAAELPAVVLSADYRLAPEHRLPAALDEAESLFSWLRAQAAASSAGAGADPWLADSADFGRVFVSGDSAGANIAHHVAVRVGLGSLAADPAIIAGCILLWPYFGGERRTASEASCPADMWRLALPAGATRDHPLANPFGPGSPALDSVALPPVLVAAGDSDMLLAVFAGQGHGFSLFEAAGELLRVVLRRFVHGGAAAPAS
ncbi:hypothetical protein SETIT_2G039900v2 [Setaria italica]|uniref:Alpha/beta hydrolase fold-3 domain-containing protein n=1 Tax=Setaria italica TaxID=4555 RepID=A0A368PUV4_SETIT|nr:hypothetical protein SETIT_2G039900v2 [Setaria italica]